MENTNIHANAVVLAEDTYQLDGVLSIFMDSVNEAFTPIPMSGYPITELGDLKGDTYSYTDAISPYSDEEKFIVNKVRVSKLTDRTRKNLANELYIGFIDFDLIKNRMRFE